MFHNSRTLTSTAIPLLVAGMTVISWSGCAGVSQAQVPADRQIRLSSDDRSTITYDVKRNEMTPGPGQAILDVHLIDGARQDVALWYSDQIGEIRIYRGDHNLVLRILGDGRIEAGKKRCDGADYPCIARSILKQVPGLRAEDLRALLQAAGHHLTEAEMRHGHHVRGAMNAMLDQLLEKE